MHHNMFILSPIHPRHHYVILRCVYYQHNVRCIVPVVLATYLRGALDITGLHCF